MRFHCIKFVKRQNYCPHYYGVKEWVTSSNTTSETKLTTLSLVPQTLQHELGCSVSCHDSTGLSTYLKSWRNYSVLHTDREMAALN